MSWSGNGISGLRYIHKHLALRSPNSIDSLTSSASTSKIYPSSEPSIYVYIQPSIHSSIYPSIYHPSTNVSTIYLSNHDGFCISYICYLSTCFLLSPVPISCIDPFLSIPSTLSMIYISIYIYVYISYLSNCPFISLSIQYLCIESCP